MSSFLLGAGTPLNYGDNTALGEVKPFYQLLCLGMWVSILFISFSIVKEIIDCCINLLHAKTNEQEATGNTVQVLLLRSRMWLIFSRHQILEMIPRNEEQIKNLTELEAEEHLQGSVPGRVSVSQSDFSTVTHND